MVARRGEHEVAASDLAHDLDVVLEREQAGERPTAAGYAMRQRLVAARTDGLRTLVADWQPDENPELDPLLRRLADELAAPA